MKKSIRILLAGANPYNANKGVAALAFSTMRILKELEQELDVEIQICVYTSESTNVYDSIVFPNGLLKFQNIYPSDLFSIGDIFRVFTSKWKLYNLRELCKCNYIVNITFGNILAAFGIIPRAAAYRQRTNRYHYADNADCNFRSHNDYLQNMFMGNIPS